MKQQTSTFELSKYYDKDNNPTTQPTEEKKEEVKKSSKTISIGTLGKDKVSGFIAKSLIEALRRDDLHLTELDEPKNDIFKNVKIMSTESINSNDFKFDELDGTDIILSDMILPTTYNEKLLDLHIQDKGIKHYYNKDKMLADITRGLEPSDEVVELEPSKTSILDHILTESEFTTLLHSFVGDTIVLGVGSVVLLFMDRNIALLKSTTNDKEYLKVELWDTKLNRTARVESRHQFGDKHE